MQEVDHRRVENTNAEYSTSRVTQRHVNEDLSIIDQLMKNEAQGSNSIMSIYPPTRGQNAMRLPNFPVGDPMYPFTPKMISLILE